MTKRYREEPRPSAPVVETSVMELRESPFTGAFRCVGMARTADGYVTVTVDFGRDGIITNMTLGRPQAVPHGQPYVAGEAKRILQASCLAT